MQGRFATRTVEVTDAECWDHAAAFETFAAPLGQQAADFVMTLTYASHIDCPDVPVQGHGKRTVWSTDEQGNGCLYHRGGTFLLTFNSDFSRCELTLREQTENLAFLRYVYTAQCFSYHMLSQNGCCVHSAALEKDGRAVLLVGASGVGKSTLATHCQTLDSGIEVLCEDLPALKAEDGRVTVYGTPFCGGDVRVANAHAPLEAVVLLKQAPCNRLSIADNAVKAGKLLEGIPYPVYSPSLVESAITMAQTVMDSVPVLVFENDGTKQAGEQLLDAWRRGFVTERREPS